MKLKKLIWVLVFPLAFTSCEDDPVKGCMDPIADNYVASAEESDHCTYDLANVLSSRVWQMTSVTTMLGESEIDLLEGGTLVPLCYQDNLLTFNLDNTLTSDENEVICTGDEVSLVDLSGTWSVVGTQLTIVNDNETYSLPATSISSSEISLEFMYAMGTVDLPATIVLTAY